MRGDKFFRDVATKPPFTKLHPGVAAFFKEYLAREKVIRYGDKFVVNTNFPPYPSPAFDRFAEGFIQVAAGGEPRLHSVTLALTNRCSYNCWHCYNAGRSQKDVPLQRLRALAGELGKLGAVCVNLTGGEPLLRPDLEDIVSLFDEKFSLSLGTTGFGLTPERVQALKDRGLFAVGVSLDSENEAEHDRLRGHAGAFRTALDAVHMSRMLGLYSYVVTVANSGLLQRERFWRFLQLARKAGAYEVHLLEPCPVGRLQGQEQSRLSAEDAKRILDYQRAAAQEEELPILSCLAYVESPEAFGCGAGLTHLYIDGSGEVSPCNFVPLSFGNIADAPLTDILERMGRYFQKPRPSCVGHMLAQHIPGQAVPTPPEVTEELCERHLPKQHDLPRFFQVRAEAKADVSGDELKAAYDAIYPDYDAFWVSEAGKPVDELVAKLPWKGTERVFEAGCGTGHATIRMCQRLGATGSILAVDLSPKMLALARQKIPATAAAKVQFVEGDALEFLRRSGSFDIIFSSWVLGYIPIAPFLKAAAAALTPSGRLAFIVHQEDSPRRELELFHLIGSQNPEFLDMNVAFDFPSRSRLEEELAAAGLRPDNLYEGQVVFTCSSPHDVLEHLLKSGAGTAYHNAVKPEHREQARNRFLELLQLGNTRRDRYEVRHDFFACVAVPK
ncbi:MAG TPA: hypothetical protein DEB40_03855 [Elusimicrobia bacterium]|nr:hypothetical protein [Elusimicrobiota bacterium]